MKTKGFIFDFDGTLVDSMAHWLSMGAFTLIENDIEIPPNYTEVASTTSMPKLTKYLFEKYPSLPKPEVMLDTWHKRMDYLYSRHVQLKNGARQFLTHLKSRGIRVCVASATQDVLLKKAVGYLGLDGFVDFTLSENQVGAGKSKPKIFEECAQKMGLTPSEIVVVEDSVFAADTAKNKFGAKVIAIQDHWMGDYEARLKALADLYIVDYTDKRILEGLK